MSTNDGNTHYFSGQGVVLLGKRDSVTGKPRGLLPLGNVSDLKISLAATVVEHHESQTGSRGIDLRLQTELKGTMSLTLENFVARTLAIALRADNIFIPGAAVTAEPLGAAFAGGVLGLKYLNVNTVTVNGGAALTQYVDDVTPFDYFLNAAAGSIRINDGSVIGFANLGTTITAITVGANTTVTAANTAKPGDPIFLTGLSGADAAVLNGKSFQVVSSTSTAMVLAVNTTGKVITATGTPKFVGGNAITADYSFSDQYRVNALTQSPSDLYLRFEGLNTVEDGAPVVVDVFKFSTDPLKELSLISDTVGQFVLEGSVLADSLRSTDSKYFSVKKLT